ncbi:hypothetical protein POJ06DRAFT_347 [Lipomyces tetrasporus]|uniref:Uncharacterized protein n=1 Tax=Lipomyces tetrasporus TaxID=54092 RepID=A0AAD7QXZ8_9ASCO|nr:uncharacterized protein POJ06DRAFT_347 [Lipomyces tetrasporus]KAJ8103396.1 hypothetical protein POJ06DRAFT_347 [Lipomyces tetrasporus]
MSIMHELPLQLPIRLYLDTMNAIVTRDGISEFNALVLIHCQTAKLVSGLEGGFDPLACNTFIALFERELDLIKTTFRQVWSTELEISLLAAKLFVYDLSLCHIGRLSSSAGRDRNLKPGELVILTYGLTAATRMIDIFNRSALEDLAIHAVGSLRSQICYPKTHFMLMVFATLFLFRVIGLPSQLERSDINLARSKVQTAINVHRRSVRESGDEHERMAALFEVLARIEPSFYLEHFRSEYSRSLIHECQRLGQGLASDRRYHHFPQVQASEDQSGPAGVSQEPQSMQSQATADLSPLDTDHTSQGLMNISDIDSAEIPWGIWDNMIFDFLPL